MRDIHDMDEAVSGKSDREIIAAIEKNASYVLTIKGNQKSLRKQLVRLFRAAEERCPELLCCFTTLDKGHGRLEERTIQVLGTHNSELCIPGILQAARVTRTREILKSGKKSKEEIFLIRFKWLSARAWPR